LVLEDLERSHQAIDPGLGSKVLRFCKRAKPHRGYRRPTSADISTRTSMVAMLVGRRIERQLAAE